MTFLRTAYVIYAVIVLLAFVSRAFSEIRRQDLRHSNLYKEIAHDCRSVEVSAWRHPILAIFKAHNVRVTGVELCNDGKYPIFTVNMPYDPEGQTSSFFYRLYDEALKANGGYPYAFVDVSDNEILVISNKNGNVSVDYEDFVP